MSDTSGQQTAQERRSERFWNIFFVLGFLVLITGVGMYSLWNNVKAHDVALLGFIAFSAVIIAFAAAVLWEIINGKIDLYGIISEPEGVALVDGKPKASLSRFQFLIFTFVVAGLFLMLSIEAGGFVNIPNNVLGLIGLSGGSFVASKAMGPKAKDPVSDEEKDAKNLKTLLAAQKKMNADIAAAEARVEANEDNTV